MPVALHRHVECRGSCWDMSQAPSKTPVSLLERLRQAKAEGDWERFVALYTPLLYAWSRRLGAGADDAADLVQEVLVLLVEKLPAHRQDPSKSFRAWLWTVLRNRWLNRRRRPREVSLDPDDVPADSDQGPAMIEESEYRDRLVARALRVMQSDFEPVTWQACWQVVTADRPAAEVAAELGISTNAVYVAKCRVLRRLREELAGLLD